MLENNMLIAKLEKEICEGVRQISAQRPLFMELEDLELPQYWTEEAWIEFINAAIYNLFDNAVQTIQERLRRKGTLLQLRKSKDDEIRDFAKDYIATLLWFRGDYEFPIIPFSIVIEAEYKKLSSAHESGIVSLQNTLKTSPVIAQDYQTIDDLLRSKFH